MPEVPSKLDYFLPNTQYNHLILRYFNKLFIMRRFILTVLCILVIGAIDAQTISRTTVEQYRQLVATCTGGNAPQHRQNLQQCADRLAKWGFTFNRSRIAEFAIFHMNPFFRKEGQDTVGCVVSTFNDAVTAISGVFSSADPARAFSLLPGAAELQESIATEQGLGKFVCSVKGKVNNKFPKSVAELKALLAEVEVSDVKWVFISWESADHKQMVTLVYDNKLYGKKKPRPHDRVELTIAVTDNRDLD